MAAETPQKIRAAMTSISAPTDRSSACGWPITASRSAMRASTGSPPGGTTGGGSDSIEAVHLQTGGSWQAPLATCRITFCDGMNLLVISGNSLGTRDDERADIYCAFVDDLHRRLAAMNSTASFTAGYTETRYRVVFACGLLLAAMFLGIPLVVLFIKPDAQLVLLFVIGAAFLWPLWMMLRKNAPRSYTPAHPPNDLL